LTIFRLSASFFSTTLKEEAFFAVLAIRKRFVAGIWAQPGFGVVRRDGTDIRPSDKRTKKKPDFAMKWNHQHVSKTGETNSTKGHPDPRSAASMTPDEEFALANCEKTIRQGWKTFVEVGSALAQIRESRLYRRQARTFEQYCREKWGYHKSQSYRLIAAAQAVTYLSPMGDVPQPTHERQVRPLLGLAPDLIRKAWLNAVGASQGNPIKEKLVRKAVRELSLGPLADERAKLAVRRKGVATARPGANTGRIVSEIETAVRGAAAPDRIITLLGQLRQELKLK
jgi:hypothetical protein